MGVKSTNRWVNTGKSILEYQRNKKNYLDDEFPRQISGWHNFSKQNQQKFKDDEVVRMEKEGYFLCKDGSWSRDVG